MNQMKIPAGKSEWVEEYEPNGKGFYKLINMVWEEGWGEKFKPSSEKRKRKIIWTGNIPWRKTMCDSYMIEYLIRALRSFIF